MQAISRMYRRISSLLIGTALVISTTASAETVVEIKQALANGTTRIIVDGAGAERYDKVVSTSLDFWVTVSGSTPDKADSFRGLVLTAGGAEIEAGKPGAARIYKITAPYSDPRSETVVNERFSPVQRCNAEIDKLSGAALAAYLESGGNILAKDAYALRAVATWWLWPGGIGFKESYTRKFTSTARADAVIECRALDRPKPRTQTHTQGAPTDPGQRMQPTIAKVALKAEPFANATVAGQQCPTRVRLYGFVETRRAFSGQLIFIGPYFLTPLSKLDFKAAGTRTVTAEYPVNWSVSNAKTSGSGLKKQSVTLRVNVTDADGKVLESDSQTVELACRPTRVAPGKGIDSAALSDVADDGAPATGQATGKRAHLPMRARLEATGAAVDFDVRIRRADRAGPGGAVRVWLYNSGPEVASGCELAVREGAGERWTTASTADIAARETVQFDGAVPEGPNLELSIRCPGEPVERQENNDLRLP